MKTDKTLLVLLVITFLLSFSALSLVAMDIQIGALRGEPETGWGILVAAWFLVPPLSLFGILSLFKLRQMDAKKSPIAHTVKVAAVVSVILIVVSAIYTYGRDRYYDYAGQEERAVYQQLAEENKNEVISPEEAADLLNTCRLKILSYGNPSSDISSEFSNPENQVVLVKLQRKPHTIWIAESAKSVLLPVAENAKKACPELKIVGS